jgi:hypothetical protein
MVSAQPLTAVPRELLDDLPALRELTLECWTTQALTRLLDATNVRWLGLRAAGEHLVDLDGVLGVLDLGRRVFVPEEFGTLTDRLYTVLSGQVGDRPVLAGDEWVEVDWESVRIVEDTPQPATVITVTAHSVPDVHGRYADLVLDTDPEGGAAVTSFTIVGDPTDESTVDELVSEEDFGGVTADYLGDYYGMDPLPFGNAGYVVDWSTWRPDQRADGGLLGSPMSGRDRQGRAYELYVWFGPEFGAEIVEADLVEKPDEFVSPGEPYGVVGQVFTEQVVPRWRQLCLDAGATLVTEDGARYDVSRWVEHGDEACLPELLDAGGGIFLVSLRAVTGEPPPREVRLRLVVEDLERVRVDDVEYI